MSDVVDKKLDFWEKRLLDMSNRNPLLNFRNTKRSTLSISVPDYKNLWECIVCSSHHSLNFPYYTKENAAAEKDDSEEYNYLSSNKIQTNQSPSDMQKTLRNLCNKARVFIEEKGINVLYLAFGFLQWNEQDNSKEFFRAPLVLVPVSLTVESIISPYILSLRESDEIVINKTLQYKLKNDYAIDIPEFDESDESIDSISPYFDKLEQLLKNKSEWKIVRETSLGLFSFLKINMYNDLKNHEDRISHHPFIRALCGDASEINLSQNGIDDGTDILPDTVKPSDTFQILDADSSQQEAILHANSGQSFVLQGPPGTGKSQTIANIIAESIARGKKVLFVSEKAAALDVVYKRLSESGIEDFCLLLHNHKANKKNILNQLQRTIDLSDHKASCADTVFQKMTVLQEDRDKLNEYAKELHTVVEPLQKTLYEVHGELAELQGCDDVSFPIKNPGKVSDEKLRTFINCLSKLGNHLCKLSVDYKKNPWFGSIITASTHELRHDGSAILTELKDTIKEAINVYDDIQLHLKIKQPVSYNFLQELPPLLSNASKSPLVPEYWVTLTDFSLLYDEIHENREKSDLFVSLRDQLRPLFAALQENDLSFELDDNMAIIDKKTVDSEKKRMTHFIQDDQCYTVWAQEKEFSTVKNLFENASKNAEDYQQIKTGLLEKFDHCLFDIDYRTLYGRLKTDYTNIFRMFRKTYYVDKKEIQRCYKGIVKKVTLKMMTETLVSLHRLDELHDWFAGHADEFERFFPHFTIDEMTDFKLLSEKLDAFETIDKIQILLDKMTEPAEFYSERETLSHTKYDFLYKGLDTDWEKLELSLHWAEKFITDAYAADAGSDFIYQVCTKKNAAALCSSYMVKLKPLCDEIEQNFLWYAGQFSSEKQDKLKNVSFAGLYDRIERSMQWGLLDEWIDLRTIREECIKMGLSEYIAALDVKPIKPKNIVSAFKKRFYRLWLDAVLPQYPAVSSFRRKLQEETIEEFCDLDKKQYQIAGYRVNGRLINRLPSFSGNISDVDERGILKREMAKQRRIMSIRKLFNKIPHLLPILKPCLMMSPLSVSIYLESESYVFDTVIFDEASQVCTEDAVGAIMRGKQVIIAGDRRQLPPTNFFMKLDSQDDEDDDDTIENDIGAYESVLDEANALPSYSLLWHYRSRYESLIAFSNYNIYDRNLITFPSPSERNENAGVEYIFVQNGIYDRGGKNGNRVEAERVAELVFDHFKKNPGRSLGVIAFGEAQVYAIEDAIKRKRIDDQRFESFFREEKEDNFFIKSLENVQGDERDTIILSIGYAEDGNGKFSMNFGPLNRQGGERRLNVAVTRARYNLKLVGSIQPDRIDCDRISSEGSKLLRSYIEYAKSRGTNIPVNLTSSVYTESPFEESVFGFLQSKGYNVKTQIGCSGYRIDMAVLHPTINGKYVIGIECDGKTYHSSRTARDRDRLRQDVLENMGWKIYRIWSTDWIKDSATEEKKLVKAVKNAINCFSVDKIISENRSSKRTSLSRYITIDRCKQKAEYESCDFIKYKETNIYSDAYRAADYKEKCMAIIQNEYPVHYEILCQRLAPLFGNEKATVKIRAEVDNLLAILGKNIFRDGDFLYPKEHKTIPVRMSKKRRIEYISCDEAAEAMYKISKQCYGIEKQSLCKETARVFNFDRYGPNIENRMTEAYNQLRSQERITETFGRVTAE